MFVKGREKEERREGREEIVGAFFFRFDLNKEILF